VAEGNINAERLITMLNVFRGELVVEEKGIYSVEKFLMARRFMYWQVYLHKTGIVAEQLLIHCLKRARELHASGERLESSAPLRFFLENRINREAFNIEVLHRFALLDDIDVLAAIKAWQWHPDLVLGNLSRMILNRQLLHIDLKNKPLKQDKFREHFEQFRKQYGLSVDETSFFVFQGSIENKAYDLEQQNINILRDNGKVTDVARASDHLNLQTLSYAVVKYYHCFPKASLQV
jgi:hypothetical protein